VFTASGTSFYIDIEGSRLPLKQLTVLNLPVFTGFPTDQPKLSRPDSVLLKDVLFFAKTIQKDSFFMAQVAQVNIEPNGTFQMVPTLGDHLVLLGTVDQLEDKLNRLFTFYKKVWLVSGVNAYQYIDCRFNHQVVALKKGLQPIQFTGDFKLLAGDSTIMMQAPVASLDTIAKTDSVKIVPVVPSPKSVKAALAKIEKPNAPKAIAKKKVQVKGGKSKPKLNNKPKNNSLNKKTKTAKAIMPKKSKSPTKNN
jgi:cell division protein FtsQ